MKAILPLSSGGFGLTEVSPPEIGPGEILVEMRACGLCGTDLAKLAHPEAAAGVRLGHELAGVVRATGAGVTRFAAIGVRSRGRAASSSIPSAGTFAPAPVDSLAMAATMGRAYIGEG